MNRAFAIARTFHQATVPANILGIILNDLTMKDDPSHLVGGNEIGWRVHGIERMRQVEDALSGSLANSFQKRGTHNRIFSNRMRFQKHIIAFTLQNTKAWS